MLDGLLSLDQINYFLVFLEGVLSFFSPCVIPLIPVYIGYLAGNTLDERDGELVYDRKKVFLHTVFFVIGISFAFFLLAMSVTALGSFFSGHRTMITRIGGILIILLGLVQVGFLNFKFFEREYKLPFHMKAGSMNPLTAFGLGFTFSFAWTPCVGPALSSVLILASGAKNAFAGNALVGLYALGFVIPFLVLGLFTSQVLNFLKKNQRLMKYTIRAGGILLIIIGTLVFTGWMNGISGYLNSFGENGSGGQYQQEEGQNGGSGDSQGSVDGQDSAGGQDGGPGKAEGDELQPAFDFSLEDQYGDRHVLSEYKGKVVFLNFWTTWCGYCKEEMPDIEALYHEYGENKEDVVFLGVANPKTDGNPFAQDVSKAEIKSFLKDGGYTFPVVFDESSEVLENYGIRSFPMTFVITKEGTVLGYVNGMMSKDIMEQVIQQALDYTE